MHWMHTDKARAEGHRSATILPRGGRSEQQESRQSGCREGEGGIGGQPSLGTPGRVKRMREPPPSLPSMEISPP